MSDGPGPLPYYCPTLRASFFKAPCAGQVAAAQNRRQTFPGAVMPYGLEQCLQCGGRDLVRGEKACIPPDEENPQVKSSVIEEVIPPNENNSPKNGLDIPLEKNHHEVFMDCSGDMRPAATSIPAAVRGLIKGQYCKHHPEVEAKVNKNGQSMGLCLECLQARAAANSRNRGQGKPKEKMTPAVARDLFKAGVGGQGGTAAVKPEQVVAPDQACKHHPDRLAHIDRLGRNMRLCPECLAERGRKVAVTNREQGINNAPFHIPIHAEKWADLKAWLAQEAEENERTLAQEVMYRLKMAMRAAG